MLNLEEKGATSRKPVRFKEDLNVLMKGAVSMADEPGKTPSRDVSRFMSEARGGQVTVDLEKWVSKLEAFGPMSRRDDS